MSHSIVRPGGQIRHFIDIKAPMRDGVELSANITLPAGDGPFPALLLRTPYDNTQPANLTSAHYFARHSYAFVVQDVRGRGDSDGAWVPFRGEAEDGYDTVEWIAAQPWCTGKVGMLGGSYAAHVQWMAAKEQPPHLAALSSTASTGRWMEDGIPSRYGILSLEMFYWLYLVHGRTLQTSPGAYHGDEQDILRANLAEALQHLPLETLDETIGFYSPTWHEWLSHPDLDDYWSQLRLDGQFHKLDIPVLHITGWFDDCIIPTFFQYEKMMAESQAADRQTLVVGPWDHPRTRHPQRELYGEDFGQEAVIDLHELERRFFDCYLKDSGTFDQPKVSLFVLGENRWSDENQWPPASMKMTPYYLDSGGEANTLGGNGRISRSLPEGAPADQYTYDPADPTPAWPGHRERWAPQALTLDQRWVQEREDVLVYTSEPLDAPLEITGTPAVVLHIRSDAPDTDIYVTLCHVYPDGRALRLTWNALRTRYRESAREAKLMTLGEVYALKFDLAPICNVFQPGHRIRVDVRSANFPLYDRNLNTGHPIGADADMRPARQTVYHSEQYPSHILLPVVPR